MPHSCCAYNCSVTSDLYPNLIFHSFPDENKQKERRQKWIQALKRKNFVPKKSTKLCSKHFKPSNYVPAVVSGNLRLKKDAVPTMFDFPEHLQSKEVRERKPLVRITSNEPDEHDRNNLLVPKTPVEESLCKTVAVQTTLTGVELDGTLNGLRREKKFLQSKLSRRDQRIAKTLMHTLSYCPQCKCEFEIIPIFPRDMVE